MSVYSKIKYLVKSTLFYLAVEPNTKMKKFLVQIILIAGLAKMKGDISMPVGPVVEMR
jgi:hypothetical protein